MSCVAKSEFSEGKLKKGDFLLKDAMTGTADFLTEVLCKKGLDSRFKIIHPAKVEMSEIYHYRAMRNYHYLRKFGFTYDCVEDSTYSNNFVKPDGGMIWLVDNKTHQRYPLVASEMKYQGTNKGRKAAGLRKQASGNANERAGKYAKLFETLWEFDDIFPFVVFHTGCDYHISEKTSMPLDSSAKTQMAKLMSMNAFHPVNKVFTSQNMPRTRRQIPYTVMVKEDFWTFNEMRQVLDNLGLDSLKYYLDLIKENEIK